MSNTETRKHHEFSPSKLDRLASCPWSYRNCLGWTPDEGDDASRGTLLHAAIYDDDVYRTLTAKEQGMIDFIRDEHVKPYVGMECYHELFVQIALDGVIITEGTLDFLVISKNGEIASLKDWKFGSYEVAPAEENQQVKTYVCGIFQRFPKVKKVYVMIVQPVFGAADYDKQVVFDRSQLPEMLNEISEIIKRCKAATEDQANPTADNCRYCNKLTCETFRKKMDVNFNIMSIDPDQLSDPEREMTLDFADRLLCAKKEIESIMDAKAELPKKLILANGGSANFRVQDGRISKRTDWKSISEKYKIPQQEIDAATTSTQGDPYLMPRMRRKAGKTKLLKNSEE